MTVIDALLWFIRHPDVPSSVLASLPLQIVREQRIKADRRKVQLRNVPRENRAGTHSRAYGNRMFRARARAMRHLSTFNTADGENTGLLNFAQ